MYNYFKDFCDEMKIRNYSVSTINIYSLKVKKYLDHIKSTAKNIEPKERVRNFLLSFSTSESRKHAYMAVKLFYKFILKEECPYIMEKVKKRKRLPTILNRNEIMSILNCIKNAKHKLIISMLYGSGLRVSEVTKIQICDVDLYKRLLLIKTSKGQKDRYTIISSKLLNDLYKSISGRNAKEYLFKTISDHKYSTRTIQIIFQKALAKSRIKKKATCHTLRHSFATHLLNN